MLPNNLHVLVQGLLAPSVHCGEAFRRDSFDTHLDTKVVLQMPVTSVQCAISRGSECPYLHLLALLYFDQA